MKKKLLILFMVIALSFALIFSISACGGNANNNKTPPQISTKLLAPHLISFGSYLSWDKVNNATEYDIYCNQKYLGTTNQLSYQLYEIKSDIEYYIIAKNDDMQSDKSNIAVVSKNCGYNAIEILDLTDKSSYSATISATVRKIIIGKNSLCSFSLFANILERNTDLIFELRNVDISGCIYTNNGLYSRTNNNYNVIFELIGNCSIKGTNGRNGDSFSDSRYDNSGISAGKGYDGNNAIVAPTVIIRGGGNCTIKGGDGGDGGTGASTTKWESTNGPGKGADGGNGGAAIKTAYFIVDLDVGDTVTIIDGKGGSKGKPGINGSIVTGPLASAMWNDVYDIGKGGLDGRSTLGTRKIIKGKIIY